MRNIFAAACGGSEPVSAACESRFPTREVLFFMRTFFTASSSARLLWLIAVVAVLLPNAQAAVPVIQRGGYFTKASDLARMRAQANDPHLASAYQQVKADSNAAIARWESRPEAKDNPSTESLMALGRNSRDRDKGYFAVAVEAALAPTPRTNRALRGLMMADLGWRQRSNYWNGMGIHEGIATSEFLEAYDIGAQLGVFTPSDHAAIREEMHQAGHFFEGWLLDNSFSRMYSDKREEAWCLNFHVYSAATLSWIAMLYPDFPESKRWLRQSESALVEYLMNGTGEDGAYGEGSVHYWILTMRALCNFFIVSKNLGVADYLAIPAIADRVRASLHWRLDMSAPDGLSWAVGDSDRTSEAHTVLHTGGMLLDDDEVLWTARMMFERGERFSIADANPLFLAHLDMKRTGVMPSSASWLYPLSGYSMFRSGWDDHANAMFFKYGTSFIGRREVERSPVISGHAHEDALEFELHYNGIASIVDGGRHGNYEQWNIYGGFSKATIAHSTVGLGNVWGYDRLDGQYAKHQAEHGADFTYERPQQQIDPADTKLMAWGDLGHVAFTSARVRTYDAVEQQRSIIWFPSDSLTIIADHLESKEEQPYEWYLTPIGHPLGKDGTLIFGDDTAKVQVLPILPVGEHATTISDGTPNLPPYYAGFSGEAGFQDASRRWSHFSLLVLAKKAKTTDFLNVLLPFSGSSEPWKTERLSDAAEQLTLGERSVLVSGRSTAGPLAVDGQCAVVSTSVERSQSYALIEGTSLRRGNQTLITSSLPTRVWEGRYATTLNALVSLDDKRAAIDLRPWPGDTTLLLNPPRAVPGLEPLAPLLVAVSFHVAAKPTQMVVLHSFAGTLRLHDPEAEAMTNWPRDYHATVPKREPLAFTYDARSGLVTVLLEPGEHQLVWE